MRFGEQKLGVTSSICGCDGWSHVQPCTLCCPLQGCWRFYKSQRGRRGNIKARLNAKCFLA